MEEVQDRIEQAGSAAGADVSEDPQTQKSDKDIRREARMEKYFKLKRRLLRSEQCIICLDENIPPTINLLCCGQPAHVKCMAGWYAADNAVGEKDSRNSKCPCPYCRHCLAEPDKPIKVRDIEGAAVSLTSKILARSRKFQDSNSLTENIIMHMTRYEDTKQRRTASDSVESGSVDSALGNLKIDTPNSNPMSSLNSPAGIAGTPHGNYFANGVPYPSNVTLIRTTSSDESNDRMSNASPNVSVGNRSNTSSPGLRRKDSKSGVAEVVIAPNGLPYPKSVSAK
jgi:hypothetical protein